MVRKAHVSGACLLPCPDADGMWAVFTAVFQSPDAPLSKWFTAMSTARAMGKAKDYKSHHMQTAVPETEHWLPDARSAIC